MICEPSSRVCEQNHLKKHAVLRISGGDKAVANLLTHFEAPSLPVVTPQNCMDRIEDSMRVRRASDLSGFQRLHDAAEKAWPTSPTLPSSVHRIIED
eukprot:870695-Amphidinium_carterae.1